MIDYDLKNGSHDSPEAGMCAMEWVAYLAGEKHSDSPACVSPILRGFCINLNDNWDDEMRQRLRPYLARCIGTADDGRDEQRGYLCLDWQVRTYLPAWLRLAKLDEEADRVAALRPITDLASAKVAGPVVREARATATATWTAAGAWTAAGDAAGTATWTAAGDAAGDAARAAVGTATWTAAGARAAARDAAWTAAWIAARAAGGAALKPTVRELQESALSLLDRMLPTETVELPEPARAEYEALLARA